MGAIVFDLTQAAALPPPDIGTALLFVDDQGRAAVKLHDGTSALIQGQAGPPGPEGNPGPEGPQGVPPAGLGRRLTTGRVILATGTAVQPFFGMTIAANEWGASTVASVGLVMQTSASAAGSINLQYRVNGGGWSTLAALAVPTTAGALTFVQGQISLLPSNQLQFAIANRPPTAVAVATVGQASTAINPAASWTIEFALVGVASITALQVLSSVVQM